MFTYICACCEDTEKHDTSNLTHLHCECGGHMYLLKKDFFEEIDNLCYKCKNYASILCSTCKHESSNKD